MTWYLRFIDALLVVWAAAFLGALALGEGSAAGAFVAYFLLGLAVVTLIGVIGWLVKAAFARAGASQRLMRRLHDY